ncbi:hypothetical protein C8R45DRAFT_1151430 [Mycena sanguinolenta]|nr:hypothetical protein C8R45DRAFT_1151430 [Mycena sanguinolenta]
MPAATMKSRAPSLITTCAFTVLAPIRARLAYEYGKIPLRLISAVQSGLELASYVSRSTPAPTRGAETRGDPGRDGSTGAQAGGSSTPSMDTVNLRARCPLASSDDRAHWIATQSLQHAALDAGGVAHARNRKRAARVVIRISHARLGHPALNRTPRAHLRTQTRTPSRRRVSERAKSSHRTAQFVWNSQARARCPPHGRFRPLSVATQIDSGRHSRERTRLTYLVADPPRRAVPSWKNHRPTPVPDRAQIDSGDSQMHHTSPSIYPSD